MTSLNHNDVVVIVSVEVITDVVGLGDVTCVFSCGCFCCCVCVIGASDVIDKTELTE